MAVSTERTVCDVLVAAMRSVSAQLGFADPQGNIRNYLIENHQAEQVTAYLSAKVTDKAGSRVEPRVWGVEVLGSEEPWSTPKKNKRTYQVTITGYYLKGTEGEGWNRLIDHATVIRGAIGEISPDWKGTVTRIVSSSPLSRGELDADGGPLVVGTLRFTAERSNADYEAD